MGQYRLCRMQQLKILNSQRMLQLILHVKSLQSCLNLCDPELWTIAHQVPLSMEFSRQEYWSGLPCPPPEDLPNPATEPASPVSYTGRHVLYHQYHLGSPQLTLVSHTFKILTRKISSSHHSPMMLLISYNLFSMCFEILGYYLGCIIFSLYHAN